MPSFTQLRYIDNSNTSFLFYLLNLNTKYDPTILGREKIFRYWDSENHTAPYEIVVQDTDNVNNMYSLTEVSNENFDFGNKNILIKVENCEQLVELRSLVFSSSYTGAVSTRCNIIIELQNDLYFQNDSLYKNGFPSTFYYEDGDRSDKLRIYIKPKYNEAKIQGIQITGQNFININKVANTTFVTIQNIYFKDCVFTKVGSDASYTQYLPIYTYYTNLLFDSCKMSIHIRAAEYGYCFDYVSDSNGNYAGKAQWKNCSLYIEYSDVDEESCPVLPVYDYGAGYFNGNKENCSIIVRNLALKINQSIYTSKTRALFQADSINCSWDIECYYLQIMNEGDGADIFTYTSGYYPYIVNLPTTNSFVSFKVAKLRYKTSEDDVIYTGDDVFDHVIVGFGTNVSGSTPYSTGINIFNTGDGHGIQFNAASHTNVKQLPENDCKNPTVLNKWGFFVNHDYTYEPLESEPTDWSETYWLYYYFDELDQVYKNIPKGMAPVFVSNQYYQKVDD